MSEATDLNLPGERFIQIQEIPDRVSGVNHIDWDAVMEINGAAERLMAEHRRMQRSDDFRAQFDLDIMYDSPAPEFGIRTVRIVLRGAGNRVNYSYSMDIREFIERTGSVPDILRNGVLLAIDRWRFLEQRRIQARLTGVSPEQWQAEYEAQMDSERVELQRRYRGDWPVLEQSPVQGERDDRVRGVERPPWLDDDVAENVAPPDRDYFSSAAIRERRARNEARRRLRRQGESRNTEPDPEVVKTVLSGLKPIF